MPRDIVSELEVTSYRVEKPVTDTYNDFSDALIAAHRASQKGGYAFAVQWPLGHSTVEARKPTLRDQRMRVICCVDGREELA